MRERCNVATPDDFTRTTRAMYEQWEKAMGTWWDQVLGSEAFLETLGKGVGAGARARGAYAQAVDESMERMHLPSKGDLVRVARIATLLEEKVLGVEDLLLELKDRMENLEREVITSRIEAAEARLELREALAAMQQEAPASTETTRAPRRGKGKSDAAASD